MPDPTKYERDFSFEGQQAGNPTAPQPGIRIDDELDNVASAIAGLVDAVKNVRRSDGKLPNGSVGPDQLSALARANIGMPLGDLRFQIDDISNIDTLLTGPYVTAPTSTLPPRSVYLNLMETIRASNYCTGDDNTDNADAIDKMVALANSAGRGANIVFKDQLYRTSRTHVLTNRVNLEGPGGTAGRIMQTTTNIDTFRLLLDEAVHVEGLWLQQLNPNQTSGSLLTITGKPTINFRSLVENCRFQGGLIQLDTQDTGILNVVNSHFVDWDIGARCQNGYNGDNGDFVFEACNFACEVGPGRAGILQHSAGGTRVVDTKIVGGKVGFLMQLKDVGRIATNATSILIICGASIEGQTDANIELTNFQGVANAHFSMVDICPGELALFGGGRNVYVHGDYKFIDSIHVRPGVMQTPPGAIGVDIDQVDGYHFAPGMVTGGYLGNGTNGPAVNGLIQPIGIIEQIGPNVTRNTRTPYGTTTPAVGARIKNGSTSCHADDEISVFHPGGSTSTTLDLVADVGLLDRDFTSCLVTVETEGLVQGAGPGCARSSFIVTRGSGLGSVTATSATAGPATAGITHVTQTLGGADAGKIRFFAQFSSTQDAINRNNLSHRIRVTGRFCRLISA